MKLPGNIFCFRAMYLNFRIAFVVGPLSFGLTPISVSYPVKGLVKIEPVVLDFGCALDRFHQPAVNAAS